MANYLSNIELEAYSVHWDITELSVNLNSVDQQQATYCFVATD